ncbi:uncharacterized protein LOC117229121 [Megalopta genalis]|uniref:uncharacterized protein LOC117229121 n=1 Tax=Megalopta genalis TaxID=115081 RepID=UPI003FD2A1E9
MLTCVAHGCLTNQNTRIDGNDVSLFPFPNDVAQRSSWLKICKLDDTVEREKPLYICKLHFEKTSFTDSMQLKTNAVPTIFEKVEEGQRKRKLDDTLEKEIPKTPPLKQKKLDDNSHGLVVTSPQSPCTQLIKNVKKINREDNMDTPTENEVSMNGSASSCQTVKIGKKQYRLNIQIDKIHGKPCPRSRKLMALAEMKKEKQELSNTTNNTDQKDQNLQRNTRKAVCAKGGCKLKKSVYDFKPAFQCEHCDKYYVMKKSENLEEKNTCTICKKDFPSLQSLNNHTKTHFVCDMCQTENSSQIAHDKHMILHVSSDPVKPYKCHQCTEIFALKQDVRQHYLIVHPTIKLQNTILQVTASPLTQQVSKQQDYRCVSCNMTFRNEHAYRNHINSHKKKEGLRCSITDTNNIFPVPNPLTGSQIGILRAVKFSCRVCSMQFDNVAEVDRHTRTHLEKDNEEEKKCNTCQKQFKTNAQLSEHLKTHEPRTHPCPVCSKTFINRTTLKIHLKSHGET